MRKLLLFTLVATLFTACTEDVIDEQRNVLTDDNRTLTVSLDGETEDTRIQLNEEKKTVWNEGDLVSVFYRSDANQQWKYDGETGARTGSLKLQLTGNDEQIKSITVRGNSGEQMAGLVYIDSSDATITLVAEMGSADDPDVGGAGGNLVFEDTVLTEVTLNCLDGTSPTEKGVALGAEATAFYIALPPQTFTKGITVEITDTTNFTMTQSTDNEVVIERNHIKPMASLTFKATKPANNEIWYTNGSTTEPTTAKKPENFDGATIQSNTYDAEKECWVITFDNEVTKIGDWAFYYCDSLTNVTIPDSVTTIGDWAFGYCESLTSVTIPDSVTTIEKYAFSNCRSLTSVTIPDSVTTIGGGAFKGCYSLTSVTIPDSVTTIGNSVFSSCYSLTSVTIPDSVTTIGIGAFSGCVSLKEFKGKFAADGGRCLIIDGVLNAFALGCGVTQYTIPDSVTTIGKAVFSRCSSLTSVTIPDSVTTIGDCAFEYCSSLTSVTIPDSVTTIGYAAFHSCISLATVYCKPTTPPTGGTWMFNNNVAGHKIYVPASDDDSIINAYKEADGWSDYASNIFEEE